MKRFSKIDVRFLKSKVSDRIIILFIVSALIPIAALAILSFTSVKKQLNEQSERRLHNDSKAIGMGVYERLLFLKAQMNEVSSHHIAKGEASGFAPEYVEQLKKRFEAMWLKRPDAPDSILFGNSARMPGAPAASELSTEEKAHLESGKALLLSRYYPRNASRIFMITRPDPGGGLLVAEVNKKYLWGTAHAGLLPHMIEIIVLDADKNKLLSSLKGPVFFPDRAAKRMEQNSTGLFEWEHAGAGYLASYWTVFLKPEFLNPGWTILLSESKAYTLAPMADFKRTFPFVVILALLVVAFMSIRQIRRHLVPLKKLQEGTGRIAERDFACRVDVDSGDEFEDLAKSFNTMADRLAKQFNALETMAEVDRAILAATDTENITDTIISRMQEISPSDSLSVALLDPDPGETATVYLRGQAGKSRKLAEPVPVTGAEMDALRDNPGGFVITSVDVGLPRYLVPMAKAGTMTYLVTPVFVSKGLAGAISLAWFGMHEPGEEDRAQVRQFANQVAVALSNARLIEELDELSWGTLIALARTVDAKSPWTAGHSERVTRMALKIGEALGLGEKDLDDLHRGGLMHDIGKIGLAPEILDKPTALTDAEMELVRYHPVRGVSILEPIKAYANIAPMVSEHHERYDGAGYPAGLKGEEISLGGRILAIADVYDATISERPYRQSMELAKVVGIIRSGAGTQFDPVVVDAFLKVIAEEELAARGAAQARRSA
jgi:response regulator RpfG family c-di-GMP phosphodiesterase/HAMP domain-containing protein